MLPLKEQASSEVLKSNILGYEHIYAETLIENIFNTLHLQLLDMFST